MSGTDGLGRRRLAAFGTVVLAAVLATVVYGVHVAHREKKTARGRVAAVDASSPRVRVLSGRSRLVFRDTTPGPGYGQVAIVPLGDPTAVPAVTPLRCDRVDVAHDGRGICLTAAPSFYTTYKAFAFGPDLTVLHGFAVTGVPSRARVSPSGHWGAVTTFVTGHSYAGAGFSTATTIYDLDRGTSIGNVESFTIVRDGRKIHPTDANFWGVTFAADDDTFYATLGTGGKTYLVRGSIRARTVRTLVTNVECPSVSPDGTRIAFKRRNPGRIVTWRLTVIDLATLEETSLAETRSVDDQAGWYDNSTVTYGVPRPGDGATQDTWAVAADGSGHPRLLLSGAWSTVAVR